jgi:hypothetical protein
MSTHYNTNDSITGERIACQFRKKKSQTKIPMTGNHRGTRMIISGNAYCVIEVQMMRIS